jgi:hypothetical protein
VDVATFLKVLSKSTAEIIIVDGVSPESFSKIRRSKEVSTCDLHMASYDKDSEQLVIRMPTVKHEMLHRLLDEAIHMDSVAIGLLTEFVSVGSATYSDVDHQGDVLWHLEGDSKRRPTSSRGRKDFPTFVIEAGICQSWGSLAAKARLWFTKSNCGVRIVVLVKIIEGSNTIKIEKWKPNARSQGMANLGACVQKIRIPQIPGSNPYSPASYEVVGGDLRLEFDDVMLRQSASAERDIVVNEARLREYAARFWMSMSDCQNR